MKYLILTLLTACITSFFLGGLYSILNLEFLLNNTWLSCFVLSLITGCILELFIIKLNKDLMK
jgi:hypothetical protein